MKILVIMTSFNGSKYIVEQIESILDQKNVEVKLLIFDDCSSDNTLHVIKNSNFDERVKVISNIHPTGSAANNFASAISTLDDKFILNFDYVSLSDQDDKWFPNKLEEAVRMLKDYNSSLYCSNLIMWDESSDKKTLLKKDYPQKKFDYLFEGASAGCTYVFTNDFCIKLKETLNKTRFFDWKFFSHDWFIYFFARIKKFNVSIDSNAYILYRIHNNNVHGHLNKFSIDSVKKRIKLVRNGWYTNQIIGFKQLLANDSSEMKIYNFFTKSYFHRIFIILKYNFNLIRSRKKYISFFFVNLFTINSSIHLEK